MFSIDSLVYGRYTVGIRSVYGRYMVGIRSVYGWYTVFFLFKPFFAILLFAKPNFGDCLGPKIKSYSGCSASRCPEELNFMMVSNDCESSLRHFPLIQDYFCDKTYSGMRVPNKPTTTAFAASRKEMRTSEKI